MKEDMKDVKKSIMEQIEVMDGEELKKLLNFLDGMTRQKEQEQGGD